MQNQQMPPTGPGGPVYPAPWPPQEAGWWAEEPEPEINLMEYVHLLWAQKWLVVGVTAVLLALAGAWAFTRPKLYTAKVQLAFESTPQVIKDTAIGRLNPWEMDRYIQNQMEVLRTRRLAKRVADKLGLEGHPDFAGGDPAAWLLGALDVKREKDADIVTVSLTGKDPESVAEWLNVYVREYIALNIEDNLERTRQVYEVIQAKLEPLREQVRKAEQQVLQFQERQGALLVGDQDKNVISEQVETLTSEYAKAKAERIRLETKINALKNLEIEKLSQITVPEILGDPTIQALRQQRNQLEVELAEKLRTYKEGHPIVKDLRSRIAGIDARIRDQVRTIVASLQTDYDIKRRREQMLYANLQSLRDQSIELSRQTMEYERLKRQYEQARTFYEDMLARSKEVDISSTAGMNNVRVIEPAVVPKGPSSPNIRRTLALGGVLGLFLGVGLVLLLDYMDQTIRTPEDAERYLGLDTLSVLQRFKDEAAFALREAYQALRTAVILAARGEGCHVLMVTSAAPGEGKTTVAFNLAKVLAASGDRVLILDGDLRRPRFHRLIKAKNVRGLTSVVLGERQLGEVVHTLADLPRLDIVTSGPLPPNPPEVFGKESFRRLLEEARREYRWVIVDTPPVTSVTDPVICSRAADMVLLVVEYGETRRTVIQEALRLLGRAGARIVGCVLNKVEMERDRYYYSHYYSYYYRYGGYGEDTASSPGLRKDRAG